MSDKSVVLMMKYTQFFFYFSLTGKVKCQGLAWVVQNNLANQGSCEMLLFFWFIFCFLGSFLLYFKVERGTNEASNKRN